MIEPFLVAADSEFSAGMFTRLILASMVAPLILGIFLPFTASLILDGLVLVLRGRGIGPLLLAVALTAVMTIVGLVALTLGGPDTSARFGMTAGFLLPWGCGLAALAFLIRQVKAASARR